jgi:hypothetical protein
LPIKAVQFTILSIIAMGYKSYVASYRSEVSSSLLPVSKTATIDKTLFYGIPRKLNSTKNFILPPSVAKTNRMVHQHIQNKTPSPEPETGSYDLSMCSPF